MSVMCLLALLLLVVPVVAHAKCFFIHSVLLSLGGRAEEAFPPWVSTEVGGVSSDVLMG